MINEIQTVKEITIALDQYPHIQKDEPISSGVTQLLGHCSSDGRCMYYDEILVIDESQNLVGRLTVRDILISFFPSILAAEPAGLFAGKKVHFNDLALLFEDKFRRECKRQAAHTVGEVMTPAHALIDASMHPLHVLEIMIKDGVNTLPVTE